MFKFKGISSKDMQVVVEEEEHFIAKASQRYEMTEIEGRDGAIFDELGYSVVERPIYVQCLNINKIDDILAWLNGEGEFEYKGRKTTARFYSQLEPQRSSCIRIIDTTFIRDPFWCKVNEDYQLVKDRKDKKASGEYIHVEDSNNCRAKIGIGGNHEQEMRSGKNYLNTLAKYKAGEKVTVDGITYIFNEDGSITCNGTATADSVLTFSSNLQTINGSGKKIVGMITGTQVPAKLSILAYTSDWSKNTFELLSSVNKNITINMQENIDYTIFRIIAYKGTTLNNQTIYYQILDTSVNDLTYEQYGASPSPDYQSEVKSVGSNVNIFDKDDPDMFLNGLTPDNSGNIVSTLTDTTKTNYIITIIVPCKGNKQYTISRWLSGKTFIVYESEKNKFNINDKVTLLKRNDNSGIINETIATSANAKYILVKIYSTWGNEENTYNDLISSIKIEKGKVATPWSPHGQGCVKVTKCNKNILKNIATSGALNGVTRTVNEDKSVTINGTSTGWANLTVGTIKGDGNSYTLSGSLSNSEIFLSVNNSQDGDIAQSKNGNEITFIPKRGLTYNVIICIPSGKTFNNVLIKPLVRISSDKDNTYEQHEEQSYIMPVQKEMLQGDYFDFDNEEEVHTWGKLVLNGTEKIGISGASTDEILAIVYDINNAIDGFGYSNCFLYSSQVALNKLNVYNNGKNLRVCVDKSKFVDLESFKSKIIELYNEGTPVMIYYKLQTPTRLAFTDEQKAVAKELNNARTYKNVTNITTDSKAILSLDYFTVTDEKIKNEGNVQSRPILRLEKTVSEAVDITINDVRFKYNFNNDKYVEIDCENKEVKFDGLERFRSIEIGYDFPKLNIGNNEITINDGDCIIKVIRKDRWL